ncbi:MAG: GPW/gp25 family protein [Cytophagales bacterium]|nr:GPW/gp25 family protein [Cytophagales bacterium]
MEENNNTILGRGWGFPISFNQASHSVNLVQDEEDVLQSLRILLSTIQQERVLEPEYGLDLVHMIFEPLSVTSAALLTRKIEQAILDFEPRIELDNVDYVQDVANGRIDITLEYTIRATNTRTNLVYPFYFTEGTDIS